MSRTLTNPVTMWNALPADVQAQIGAAAIAAELAAQGSTISPPKRPSSEDDQSSRVRYTDRHDTAGDITRGLLQDLLAENLPDAFDDAGDPHHIDLNPFGVRQCTECGCTDDHACDPLCHWIGPTTCSACATTHNPPPEKSDAA